MLDRLTLNASQTLVLNLILDQTLKSEDVVWAQCVPVDHNIFTLHMFLHVCKLSSLSFDSIQEVKVAGERLKRYLL